MRTSKYAVFVGISALALGSANAADLSNAGSTAPPAGVAIAQNLSTASTGNRELSWRSGTIHSQVGQSFVAAKDGVAGGISLFLTSSESFTAYASPVTFKLKVFSGATAATAVELGSYTYDATPLGDGVGNVWLQFGLDSGIPLTSNSTYSFILTFDSLNAAHRLNFQRNKSGDQYADGDELRPATSGNDYDAANFDTDPWDNAAPQGAGGVITAIANNDLRFSVNELITQNLPPVADDISKATILTTPTDVLLSGSDANNDPLTFTVQDSPTNGTLSGTSPDLIYTADSGFAGTDTFTYYANDGTTNSELATVTITVLAGSGIMSNVGISAPADLIGGDDAATTRSREVIRTDSQTFVVGQSFTLAASTNVTEIYLKSANGKDFGTFTGGVEIKVFSGVGASAVLEHTSLFNGAANDQGAGLDVADNDWVRFVLQDGGVTLPAGENSFLVHWSEKGTGNKWGIHRSNTGIYADGNQYEVVLQSGDAYPQWDSDPWSGVVADNDDDLCFYITSGASTIAPIDLYEAWAGANGGNIDMTVDTDFDGMDDLLEYALGGNPTTNDAAAILPVSETTGGSFLYIYSRRDDYVARGLTYSVLSSTDLVFEPITNATTEVGASAPSGGFETVTNSVSTAAQAAQFINLEVELSN